MTVALAKADASSPLAFATADAATLLVSLELVTELNILMLIGL